jgi:N-acetylneuraminate synthase/N,N'-diacetyllegionaminate synthase
MELTIQNRKIGDGHPVFFIAEAGVNHNGSLELAHRLIDVAVDAGVDAVKFQTFKAENLNTKNAPKSTYHVETTGNDEKQTWFELLQTQEMSREMHLDLIKYCQAKNIIFLSTPYDLESVELLDQLGVSAFKLASTDTNNLPLIRHIARKRKPLIISTAMCEMSEVIQAVEAIRSESLEDFVVLQCTGNYPAQLRDSHLRVITTYREKLHCLVGYSDHTLEIINPIAAIALGACVYEKHFTIDKSLPGPDHRSSLSPDELKETVRVIRLTEKALGCAEKFSLPSEQENRLKLRKSLVAATDISKETRLTRELIAIKRPGTGISPSSMEDYLGRELVVDVQEDSVLMDTMFSK